MTRIGRMLLLTVAMLALPFSRANAQQVEFRDFNVLVDGKKVGLYQMAVGEHSSGMILMAGKAGIKITKLGFTVFSYSYAGTETYKDGRLITFKSNTNDNGKLYAVVAEAKGNDLQVKANQQERTTRGDVWPTSYWKLPPARYRNGDVPLLDADTGRDINGKLQYIDTEQKNVAGKMQQCTHYRLTGGPSAIDLWYDAQERLVYQDYLEDGHRTILEVTSIRR
jgi:hypothetical protein